MGDNFDHDFFRTSGVEDFKLRGITSIPEGYPKQRVEDTYSTSVVGRDFEERKQIFIEHVLKNPGSTPEYSSVKGFFYELIRINENIGPIHEQSLFSALDYINDRYDCADFVISGMMRLYKQLGDKELVSEELLNKTKQTILDFKYWPDEPGTDSMCYWTENHHIIFSAAEYLAGQWFPNEVFTNSGMTGIEKKERARKRIYKWLELRFYTGFNEWLSNVYYDEDFVPLLNLYDFCDDEEIKRQAKQIIDLMLYDMAINSYKGLFACTHGRTYTKEKLHPSKESTADTAKLMFGLGTFANEDNMSAVVFALSNYRMPELIGEIARSENDEWINKQRVSIKFKDAKKWGYGKLDTESAMGLLSFGGYTHHKTFNHLALMLNEFNWWDNKFFLELKPFEKIIKIGRHINLTTLIAWILRKDMSRNAFTENNAYTYKTPDYMLSTSQSFRPSYGGDQHHIWQATLDNSCVCFTTHPGGYGETAPDAYWHGNGFMPNSVQHKNVNISIYNTTTTPTVVIQKILDFTHAFFPKDRYDEVVEKDGWVFGRSNNGYIGIYSMNGYQWQTNGEYKDQEMIAKGKKNIWITEMGRKDINGSFDNFIESILNAELSFKGLSVKYNSPTQGLITFGWRKPLIVNGKKIKTKDYKRYENPTSITEFESNKIIIKNDNDELTLKI